MNDIFLTVVVPALNEEDNITLAVQAMLKDLDTCKIKAEIIVVNDGSTDSTPRLVKEMMDEDSRVRLLEHATPQGVGASFWDGADAAKGNAVVFLPGDNENSPYETFRYCSLLEDVDLVVPFVFNKDVRSRYRNFLSSLFLFVVNSTFGTTFNYTNATIIYRKSILQELKSRNKSFFYQADNLIRLTKAGYLFAEVPYKLLKREAGVSKATSLRQLSMIIKDYFRLAWDVYITKELKQGSGFAKDSQTAIRRS